jgi:hypothetical protein
VVDRDENARKERLRVRSPFGLIAVRGTMFFAGPGIAPAAVELGREALPTLSR